MGARMHITRVGSEYLFSVEGINTKSGQAACFPLPLRLTDYIDRYLADYRQRFHRANEHTGLWPSGKGVPLTEDAVYEVICRRTKAKWTSPSSSDTTLSPFESVRTLPG